ncbi:MAG TPA: 2-oxo acid dehydrogenase subunit E2, partial [Jiangellaceae bacterium]|nr:2-oxo acid dehydrogenase subunit E2 [Jiangellaceae bacterium]
MTNRTGGAAVNTRRPYQVQRVPRGRQVILDVLAGAARRYPVHALVEFDVTVAEQRLRDGGGAVSWTGFVVATVARAVAAHPEVNARRAGGRLLLFDRVDVAATVERSVDGALVPVAVSVRNADRKSGQAITEELHRAKTRRAPEAPRGRRSGLAMLPSPVRRRLLRLAGRSPAVAARFGPPVGVTSLGMFAAGGGWAIPIAPLTVTVTVGAVTPRPMVIDGQVVARSMLPLTVTFDHSVVDGAPAAR